MNKRKIILISITLLLTGQLAAQQDTVAQYDEEKCYHSLYVYGSIGAGDIMLSLIQYCSTGELRFGHYDAGVLYLFHFNRHWGLGVGTEFHGSDGLWCIGGFLLDKNLILYHKDLLTLPVYANFRYTIGKRAVKTVLELKAGYAFPLRTVYAYSNGEVYSQTNTDYPEPGFQGPMKAGGFYGGMAAGIHIRRFLCVTLGSSFIPCTADLVDYSTGAALYKNGLMWNFYIRCGLNVLGIRKK